MALFFFGNPIFSALEDRLWHKARRRYVEDGGSPIKDLDAIDRETRHTLRVWVEQWRGEESEKLRPVWKEFKRTMMAQVATALQLTFQESEQGWYAVENSDSPSFPKTIALPLLLLRRQTEQLLPGVLGQKIQFKDLLQETREVLAKYATDRGFTDELYKARKEYRNFSIAGRHNPFVLADLIERDFYHLGTRESASRVDMVILTTFRADILDKDKQRHRGERVAIDEWNKFRPERSDTRRFSGDGWDLSETELYAMARQ